MFLIFWMNNFFIPTPLLVSHGSRSPRTVSGRQSAGGGGGFRSNGVQSAIWHSGNSPRLWGYMCCEQARLIWALQDMDEWAACFVRTDVSFQQSGAILAERRVMSQIPWTQTRPPKKTTENTI